MTITFKVPVPNERERNTLNIGEGVPSYKKSQVYTRLYYRVARISMEPSKQGAKKIHFSNNQDVLTQKSFSLVPKKIITCTIIKLKSLINLNGLHADIYQFLCFMWKSDVCETLMLIVFRYPAVSLELW